MGRYFWVEDMVSEVDHFDRSTSKARHKATAGTRTTARCSRCFLCVAAGAAPKTLLTAKAATALLRKIRKTGLKPELVGAYIHNHALEQHRADYLSLWQHFIEDALPTLESDHAHVQADALPCWAARVYVTD